MNAIFKKNISLPKNLKSFRFNLFSFRNLSPRLIGGQATTPPHRRAGYHPASSAGRLQPSAKGFTLVEMLVSVSVFMVVMTVASGSLLSIIDGNGKAQSLKSAVNNLNFAIESMAKEIRVGNTYTCVVTAPATCLDGADNISFTSAKDENVTYKFVGSPDYLIGRCKGVSCSTFTRMTAPGVIINNLIFYIAGTNPDRVLITTSGTAGSKERLKTKFNLQTTVSQRSF